MPTPKPKKEPTGRCDCQWDDHFADRAVPGTVRHEYGARTPKRDLQQVGTFERTGKPVMKCTPCRMQHNSAALLAKA